MKYAPLEGYLKTQFADQIELGFREIEKIIGAALPASARRHRAWWSNNPDNSVATNAWLNAGFRSAQVDMAGERLVFERLQARATASLAERARTPWRAGHATSLYGRFRGAFKFSEGSDLCAPTGERWAATHD